ncbi:MAG: c-type cytochrome [Vicinamibacterales bacterium]
MSKLTAAVLVLVGVFAPAPLAAQRAFPPAAVTNLTVLAADTPVPQVIATMRAMTIALGVRCQHCHVGVEGQPLTTFDFVADTVPAKATARAMLRLTRDINMQLRAARPDAPEVTCYTCHRGATTPVHVPPAP